MAVKTLGQIEGQPKSWQQLFWEVFLVLFLLSLVVLTIFILNFPYPHNPRRAELVEESDFSEEDKKNPDSGYDYFEKHRGGEKSLRVEASVTVLVLGDIGRSPRMQYHVASIAKHGGKVSLVGYVESEILPEVRNSRFVRIIPLNPIPKRLQTSNKWLFPLVAPLKVLYQLWSVWRACGFRTKATKWMLVQNPPSIPTLLIAQFVCWIRDTRLVIDWHNFGYTILALKLGQNHPLVKLSEWYEQYVARWANAHFCVTNAMARVLKQKYGVEAVPLHDRPSKQFQPLNSAERSEVLHRLGGTKAYAKRIENKEWRLLVSSTSWTVDEDFSLLLEALVAYSATVSMDRRYPKILAIITGKGPNKDYYLRQIQKLKDMKRLSNIVIETAWLSLEDYASLLGAADVGVSLHKSSSGVDLPMKVVDMFGAGLPVFGYSKFEAWKELVQDGVNGMGFETAEELETLLEKAFTGNGNRLEKLRVGAEKETRRRWDDEWFPVAGKVLQLSGTTIESAPKQPGGAQNAAFNKKNQTLDDQLIGPARPEQQPHPVHDEKLLSAEDRAQDARAYNHPGYYPETPALSEVNQNASEPRQYFTQEPQHHTAEEPRHHPIREPFHDDRIYSVSGNYPETPAFSEADQDTSGSQHYFTEETQHHPAEEPHHHTGEELQHRVAEEPRRNSMEGFQQRVMDEPQHHFADEPHHRSIDNPLPLVAEEPHGRSTEALQHHSTGEPQHYPTGEPQHRPLEESPRDRSLDDSWQDLSASSIQDAVPQERHGGTFLSYAPMRPESS